MVEQMREVSPDVKKEKPQGVKIWEQLADAFGGYSQLPDHVVGMAIIGQVNNRDLKFGQQELDEVVNQICEKWKEADSEATRAEILRGMKEGAKEWPREDNKSVWNVIDALEK